MSLESKFVGKVLDKRYKINRIIGVGGMSVVFEAYDAVAGRTVAVKVLKDEFVDDEQTVSRFVNECRAVSMLSHPNIVKIYDVSFKGRLKYIVMERIEGITLNSYMQKKGALTTSEILSYAEQILAALSHAHSKGIIHRDIKPQNILLLRTGKVKVSDFGIATIAGDESSESKAVGTVYYISPEQAAGKKVDARTDLYSLGIMMYQMATGILPFNGDTPVEIARKHLTELAKTPRSINEDIPVGLEQIVMTAMEKLPDKRFASAAQMAKYVSRLRTNPDYIFKTGRKNHDTILPDSNTEDMAKNSSKKKKKESRTMFPIICGVTVAFLIVFATAAFYLIDKIMKQENENSPITIEVPAVVGEVYDEKLTAKLDPSIYKIVTETKYDANVEENTVIKQDPAAGSKRKVLKYKQYCTITLTISKGSQKVSIPDFTVLDYRTAQLKAEKLGLKVNVEEISDDYIEIGYVVKTSPMRGETVAVGSEITIYYSKGATVTKYSVPSMTGSTPSQAYSKMNGNFAVGQVTYKYSEKVAAGKIISQSISSGTKVARGTPIDFVISLGKEPVVTEAPVEEVNP